MDNHDNTFFYPALHRVAIELSSPTGSYWPTLLHPVPADTGMNQDGGNGAEGRVQTSTQSTA